jgi:glycosidase
MKRYPNLLLTFVFICLVGSMQAQIERVEPPNWWVGMESNELQLLVKGQDIQRYKPVINYAGVSIKNIHTATSGNYLFIDLEIAPSARAGRFDIDFKKGRRTAFSWSYELKVRDRASKAQKGFDASDVIYLITPDRFANGNPENDIVEGMLEQSINRAAGFGRHGGDIQGIIDHLDYIQEMGFTAIWPSPLLENDMPQWSYHGYAITDYYEVDARFGTLEDYVRLADEARERGIKLIMDGVANHCGAKHWWMEDPPFDDWVNFQQSEETVVTNHRRTVNQDAYAAEVDKANMNGGWFVPTMPDLNQRNPFMGTYLIQNSIWWVEVLGLGGIRQDTYPYPYKDFLTDWTCKIMNEYPDFNIVGEEWSTNPLIVAYWQEGKDNPDGYQSCLRSVMDFPIQEKLVSALTGDDKQWGKGLVELYDALANDFVYADPFNIMTFGDNHDMDRIATSLGGDPALMQMAMTYLLTIRGIPQVYYGTEIMMNNDGYPGDHGIIRSDFPGGWEGDEVNAVSGDNLSADQASLQQYMKKLLNWRKNETTIHMGKTKHFAPEDGTYVYFRYTDDKMIMVVMNKNEEKVDLDTARFREMIGDKQSAKNIITGKPLTISSTISVPARYAVVLEIQ